MSKENILKNNGPEELNDDMLDVVSGGTGTDYGVTPKYNVGDVVLVNSRMITYCPKCSALTDRFEATITTIYGVVYDSYVVYGIKYKCCGYENKAVETAIEYKIG